MTWIVETSDAQDESNHERDELATVEEALDFVLYISRYRSTSRVDRVVDPDGKELPRDRFGNLLWPI